MRTATTATDRSSTGGICQARVISHAEIPAWASALPNDNTPSAMAARTRGSRGRSRLAASNSGSDRRIGHPTVRDHFDDPITDGHNGFPVADHHHRRTGAGPRNDGP